MFQKLEKTFLFKFCAAMTSLMFALTLLLTPAPVYAQSFQLPIPGMMIKPTPGFHPPKILGLTIDTTNPLAFNFLIDTGDDPLGTGEIKDHSAKLIKYFMASLTVPEDEMWVNLSPYENDRIIPTGFGMTEMGRDLLAQDYMLKQLTASLMYPEDNLGAEFWDRVYTKAMDRFGTTDIPMNTFNKIWIVPERAAVYEHEPSSTAFVLESSLKVMLEEDYVALQNSRNNSKFGMEDLLGSEAEVVSGITSQVVREVLIPEIEREVNQGKTFANLRQIYDAMILAAWYKNNLRESLLGHVYIDQNKVRGIELENENVKYEIYEQYVQAFKQGVYDYIKEDYDPVNQQIIPRKYFSGGFAAYNEAMTPLSDMVGDGTFRSAAMSFSDNRRLMQRIARAARGAKEKIVRVTANLLELTGKTARDLGLRANIAFSASAAMTQPGDAAMNVRQALSQKESDQSIVDFLESMSRKINALFLDSSDVTYTYDVIELFQNAGKLDLEDQEQKDQFESVLRNLVSNSSSLQDSMNRIRLALEQESTFMGVSNVLDLKLLDRIAARAETANQIGQVYAWVKEMVSAGAFTITSQPDLRSMDSIIDTLQESEDHFANKIDVIRNVSEYVAKNSHPSAVLDLDKMTEIVRLDVRAIEDIYDSILGDMKEFGSHDPEEIKRALARQIADRLTRRSSKRSESEPGVEVKVAPKEIDVEPEIVFSKVKGEQYLNSLRGRIRNSLDVPSVSDLKPKADNIISVLQYLRGQLDLQDLIFRLKLEFTKDEALDQTERFHKLQRHFMPIFNQIANIGFETLNITSLNVWKKVNDNSDKPPREVIWNAFGEGLRNNMSKELVNGLDLDNRTRFINNLIENGKFFDILTALYKLEDLGEVQYAWIPKPYDEVPEEYRKVFDGDAAMVQSQADEVFSEHIEKIGGFEVTNPSGIAQNYKADLIEALKGIQDIYVSDINEWVNLTTSDEIIRQLYELRFQMRPLEVDGSPNIEQTNQDIKKIQNFVTDIIMALEQMRGQELQSITDDSRSALGQGPRAASLPFELGRSIDGRVGSARLPLLDAMRVRGERVLSMGLPDVESQWLRFAGDDEFNRFLLFLDEKAKKAGFYNNARAGFSIAKRPTLYLPLRNFIEKGEPLENFVILAQNQAGIEMNNPWSEFTWLAESLVEWFLMDMLGLSQDVMRKFQVRESRATADLRPSDRPQIPTVKEQREFIDQYLPKGSDNVNSTLVNLFMDRIFGDDGLLVFLREHFYLRQDQNGEGYQWQAINVAAKQKRGAANLENIISGSFGADSPAMTTPEQVTDASPAQAASENKKMGGAILTSVYDVDGFESYAEYYAAVRSSRGRNQLDKAPITAEEFQQIKNANAQIEAMQGIGRHKELLPNAPQNLSSNAMTSQASKEPVGGIDLDPAMLDLQIKRDGRGIPLPINLQPLGEMQIEGFLPIIINITPVQSLPALLGLAEDEVPTDISFQPQLDPVKEPELNAV